MTPPKRCIVPRTGHSAQRGKSWQEERPSTLHVGSLSARNMVTSLPRCDGGKTRSDRSNGRVAGWHVSAPRDTGKTHWAEPSASSITGLAPYYRAPPLFGAIYAFGGTQNKRAAGETALVYSDGNNPSEKQKRAATQKKAR